MNLADYFTKHHPPAHHQNVQGEFLTRVAELQKLRQEQAKYMEIFFLDPLNLFVLKILFSYTK